MLFFLFLHENICCEALPMSTFHICFHVEIKKKCFFWYPLLSGTKRIVSALVDEKSKAMTYKSLALSVWFETCLEQSQSFIIKDCVEHFHKTITEKLLHLCIKILLQNFWFEALIRYDNF